MTIMMTEIYQATCIQHFSEEQSYQSRERWKVVTKKMKLQHCTDTNERQNMFDASCFNTQRRPDISTYLIITVE